MSGHDNEDLIDYEDEHDVPTGGATTTTNGGGTADAEAKDKKNFSGIHSTGFRSVLNTSLWGIHVPYGLHVYRDFLLKPELVRAISDLGFEHPSEGD